MLRMNNALQFAYPCTGLELQSSVPLGCKSQQLSFRPHCSTRVGENASSSGCKLQLPFWSHRTCMEEPASSSSCKLQLSLRSCRPCREYSNSVSCNSQLSTQDAEFDQLEEEDLDAMFEEYGEVVRTDEESNSVTSEVDDDSDSLAFAIAMAEAANDVKASDIQVLCVKPLIYWARFFVVVTAFSKPQIDAVGSRMRDMAEGKFNRTPKGDSKPNSWTLLDFGDVVVHIFLPKERAFYNLEEFYGNATLVSLPFEKRETQ